MEIGDLCGGLRVPILDLNMVKLVLIFLSFTHTLQIVGKKRKIKKLFKFDWIRSVRKYSIPASNPGVVQI